MTSPVTQDMLQYIYCAVCLELQDIPDRSPELAITIVSGTAVCEEHRRRVDGFQNAVRGTRRYLERRDGAPQKYSAPRRN